MLHCKFKLTRDQVKYFDNNYRVYFGDDFRGSIEVFIKKELGENSWYEITVLQDSDYFFEVSIKVNVPNDIIALKKIINITSELDFHVL